MDHAKSMRVLDGHILVGGLVGLFVAAAVAAIFVVAPEEASMGAVQKIVYVHVSVAWGGLAACLCAGVTGAVYLVRRDLQWDHWSQATAELGWLATTLTLATGSLWAHEAWNTWWTWEPRLTSALILWFIYSAYFLLRNGIDDPHDRARVGAAIVLLGMLDLPMIVMATRWFRGVHPVSPEMDSTMRAVLLFTVMSFTALFAFLVVVRRGMLSTADRIIALEQRQPET